MSGGHFNYQQYRIKDIATEIDELIASNDDETLDQYGYRRGRGYSEKTIARFAQAAKQLRIAATMAQRVDWLVSGDDGEESFHRRWEEELSTADHGEQERTIS
jgi:hypothetical protein